MTLSKFARTDVDVDGMQWLDDRSNTIDIINQFIDSIACYDASKSEPKIHVSTPEGIIVATPGCWLTKTLTGIVRVIKPEVFESTFTAKK